MADALLCNQLSAFLSLYPQASPLPTPVPSSLLQVNCGMSEARLDLCKLGNSVCKYFQQGLAPLTQRSYESAKAHFINFCSSAGSYALLLSLKTCCVSMSHFQPIYKDLAHSSIKCQLAAARYLQISHGLPGDMPCLKADHQGNQILSNQTRKAAQALPSHYPNNPQKYQAGLVKILFYS